MDQASTAECAAKAVCLRPSTNATLLANALELARRAVELGKGDAKLPLYQITLGLAEYLNGQYANAEKILGVAELKVATYREIQGTARLFRAMSLYRLGRKEEARRSFSVAEAEMPPLPADERKPLANGELASHDVMIWWLAYKEAKSLINDPGGPKP